VRPKCGQHDPVAWPGPGGRWRAVNAPLVALVRAGATFTNGKLIEWPGQKAQPDTAQ